MPLQAATISTKDGREIVAIAVRPSVLDDERRLQGVLDTLRGLFPDREIVLVASTSKGFRISSDSPEMAATVRKRGISRLRWHGYAAMPA
jgi:hypothetical protein